MIKNYAFIGFVSIILGFIGKLPYRSFIYENNINDFGIADSSPSFFYLVGIIFIILCFSPKKDEKTTVNMMMFMTFGALVYELEPLSSVRIFDVKDVVATFLAFGFSYGIYKFLLKKQGQ